MVEQVDGDRMAGLVELSHGVMSYAIGFMSFMTTLNEIVMNPCDRTRVTAATETSQTSLNKTTA